MRSVILSEAIVGSTANDDKGEIYSFSQLFQFKAEIVWRNVIVMLYLHLSAVNAMYLIITGQVMLVTYFFVVLLLLISSMGITAGAHRLWTHRSYKATWQLRLFLMICNSMCFQNSIHEWARDHRVHHKHVETDADPHNAARGFFFSHMGWLMLKKHPDVIRKGKEIDMSDIEKDEIVMFQKRNYYWLMPLFTFVLPAASAHYFLGETLTNSWYVASIFRYVFALHGTWCVNSVAHFTGHKPYDKNIAATNNTFVSILAMGEGWHNYHHVFPWDYKTSELGLHSVNYTCAFIDFCSKIGWAYELKTVPEDLIRKRAERTGDHMPYKYTKCVQPKLQPIEQISHHYDPNENCIWGWDDKDMNSFDKESATILN